MNYKKPAAEVHADKFTNNVLKLINLKMRYVHNKTEENTVHMLQHARTWTESYHHKEKRW